MSLERNEESIQRFKWPFFRRKRQRRRTRQQHRTLPSCSVVRVFSGVVSLKSSAVFYLFNFFPACLPDVGMRVGADYQANIPEFEPGEVLHTGGSSLGLCGVPKLLCCSSVGLLFIMFIVLFIMLFDYPVGIGKQTVSTLHPDDLFIR